METNPALTDLGSTGFGTAADPAAELISRTLVAYANVPGAVELARLTDGLLTHGQGLLAAAEGVRGVDGRVAGALRDWARLTADGPEDTSLGNWNHARALARAVRTLRRGLGLAVPETPKERIWVDWDCLPEQPEPGAAPGSGPDAGSGAGFGASR
ncbi:DUF6415 family natural product biosynthesis protein [Streptomyces sp. NPDC097619]|uniref:DUF6415 family natural product biosynthesis protein n=1 Tax=Streptomyces sp. NPDC097619 TaxID=3157228 RepID=UPI003323EC18